MTETDSQPIAENEQVKELLALLKDNNTPGYEEFSKLIEHVTGMEQRLLEATEELKAVRQEMQGLQNHSLKDALQKSYTAMEANISVMRHRLSELKSQIINGCRNTIFVGFPIWWYVAPTIINTFLESYDLTGKTVIPFATSGGSGIGKTNERLAPSCKGAKLMDGKVFKGSVGHQELAAWVEGLGF